MMKSIKITQKDNNIIMVNAGNEYFYELLSWLSFKPYWLQLHVIRAMAYCMYYLIIIFDNNYAIKWTETTDMRSSSLADCESIKIWWNICTIVVQSLLKLFIFWVLSIFSVFWNIDVLWCIFTWLFLKNPLRARQGPTRSVQDFFTNQTDTIFPQ